MLENTAPPFFGAAVMTTAVELPTERPVYEVDQPTIDATTAWDLRPELIRALYTRGPELWLDLGKVTFIDSTGLGMLVSVLKEAREMKGDIHLINTGREVRRILDVTGLRVLFESTGAPHPPGSA
jgi:anti-sigma B factor antagonist